MRRLMFGPVLAALMGAVQAQPSAPPRQTPANDQSQPPPSTTSQPSSSSARQQPPSTAVFRTEVNYVEVDVSVTDEKGNFVRGLTRDDFQILEEKIPQKIATFTEVAIPVERTETTLVDGKPLPRDTASNQQPLDGRIYVMVLDDVHTHALRSSLVKKAASEFIEKHLGRNDLAAVVYTGGRTDAGQEFTSNKLLLEQAVNRFMGRKIRSATLERLDAYNRQRGTLPADNNRQGKGIQDPLDFERAYNARTAMGSLENVAKYLNNVQGRRKAILFFSEGLDYDTLDVMGDIQRNASDVLYAMKDAIAAATQNNVAFYTIDPRGLGAMFGDESIEMTAPPEDPAYGISTQSLESEARRSQDSLRTLAEETGGLAAVNTNDFATAYDRIVRANSHYYLLGYYPKYGRRDGRFRRIEVRVKRPGVKVMARKGYLAPRGDEEEEELPETPAPTDTSAEVKELLGSPLPQPGLTLGVTAAAFKGTGEKADVAVTIQVPGQGLSFKEEDGRAVNQIEVSLIAIDQKAKVQGGDRVLIDPKLRPETHQLVQLTGFRLVRKLELAPGRYQLRVAAREEEKGTRGSVFYDLDVPDFDEKKLSMSGLLLTSRAAALTLTPALDDEIKKMLETPPTPVRTFVPGDTLTAYAEVYDRLEQAHNVAVTARVKALDGREVFRATEQRASTEREGKSGGYGHKVEIPLVDVKPGRYVLQIEAVPTIGKEAVLRELSFEVVAPPAPPSSTAQGAQEAQGEKDAVAFANFAFGPLSNHTKPEQIVIGSQAEWEKVWESLPTKKPLPQVDFEKEMLVAVFLGRRSTGGYSVRVDSVRREGRGIVVAYREVAPASGAVRTQQLTTPFVVARIVKSEGSVRFQQVGAGVTSQ